jgi:hypothetical protein
MFPSLSEPERHACQWRVLQFGNLLLQVGKSNNKAPLKSDGEDVPNSWIVEPSAIFH